MDDGLRVIVGDDTSGLRSALWRVWTARRTSDVYLGARPIAGEVRVSLHESGKWRYAFTTKHQFGPKPLIGPDEDRAKFRWDRPPEVFPGFTRAFVICVPSTELMEPTGPDTLKKPATWLPVPPCGHQVEIDIWLARPPTNPATWPGMRSMGTECLYRKTLPSGEDLIVTAYVTMTDEERRRNMDRDKANMLKALRPAIAAGADASGHNVRGVLFSVPGREAAPDLQGVRAFTDVSFPRELLEVV